MGTNNQVIPVADFRPTRRAPVFNPSSWPDGILVAVLSLLAALPYANSLLNRFVYDDLTQVLGNPYVRSFRYWRSIFTTTAWSYLGGARGTTNLYRPMMNLQYLLCFQVFGPRAWAFHLVSVLLHAAVVVVLFKVSQQMFQNRAVAFSTAALFAIHPIHTESVDWIAGVTDLQLSLFYLGAFWFFLQLGAADKGGVARTLRLQSGMAASFALALLSKEPAVTLPVVATVYEHFYRGDRSRTNGLQKFSRYGVLWLLVCAYFLFRMRVLGAITPAAPSRLGLAADELLFSAFALVGQALWKLVWPVRLCLIYVFPAGWAALLPRVSAGILAASLCGLLFVALWRRARSASFGLVWLLVTLAPVLDLRWMPANAFSERYLYLPSAGFCWIAGWAVARLWDAAGRRGAAHKAAMASGALVVVALCLVRIVTRNREWRDDITLYRSTLAISPDADSIHNNLGEVYWREGRIGDAESEWLKAQQLAPDAVYVLDNLGLLYADQKRYDEALTTLKRALQIAPNDVGAKLSLGIAYKDMGQMELAESQLRSAVALAPLNIRARNELAELYFDQGRLNEAAEQFRSSLEIGTTARAFLGLGLVYWREANRPKAEAAFKSAEALDPSDSRPHFLLALLYGDSGRVPDAMREYEAGFKTDPNNAEALAAFRRLKSQASGSGNAKP